MKLFFLFRKRLLCFLTCFCILLPGYSVYAQCPANIDFELGDFTGWQCYIGTFTNGTLLLNPSLPTPGRHDMLTAIPGNGSDPYGGFPLNCPNGSSHSIQLGNSTGGGQAERVSYTFTIPATKNEYSLIYHYAIVLNDGNHPIPIQPRLTIDIRNITDNISYPCSSFDIAITGSITVWANCYLKCKATGRAGMEE